MFKYPAASPVAVLFDDVEHGEGSQHNDPSPQALCYVHHHEDDSSQHVNKEPGHDEDQQLRGVIHNDGVLVPGVVVQLEVQCHRVDSKNKLQLKILRLSVKKKLKKFREYSQRLLKYFRSDFFLLLIKRQ